MDLQAAFAHLGLSPQADLAEARAAYRLLARRWVAVSPSSTESRARLEAVSAAYLCVSRHLRLCEQQLAAHDAAQAMAPSDAGFVAFDPRAGFGPVPGASASAQDAAGPVARPAHTLWVGLYEAAFGCVKRVCGSQPGDCPQCAGSGTLGGSWTLGAKCLHCFGRGVDGGGTRSAPCAACQGSGVVRPAAPPACPRCRGSGRTPHRSWMVDVHVAAGSVAGAAVPARAIRKHGPQPGGPQPGFTLAIERHPLFRLEQDRLAVRVPLSVWRWLLGGEACIPTLEGSQRVRLPPRAGPLQLPGQGWPEPGRPLQRKPLLVFPRVVYPPRLRDAERRTLELLAHHCQPPEVAGWQRHVDAWTEPAAGDA